MSNARLRRAAPLAAIAFTLLACSLALLWRGEIRGWWWARRIAHAADARARAGLLTLLCNSGDSARWGVSRLARSSEPELRQFAVLVAQRNRTPWARQTLLAELHDPQERIRNLAALGLALQGDDAVLPDLVALYRDGDDAGAAAACTAIRRLGTPAARTALFGLADIDSASVERRAALVDSLAELGEPECIAPLSRIAADPRACDEPTLRQKQVRQMWESLRAEGAAGIPLRATAQTSMPADEPQPPTLGERAQRAIAKIRDRS